MKLKLIKDVTTLLYKNMDLKGLKFNNRNFSKDFYFNDTTWYTELYMSI